MQTGLADLLSSTPGIKVSGYVHHLADLLQQVETAAYRSRMLSLVTAPRSLTKRGPPPQPRRPTHEACSQNLIHSSTISQARVFIVPIRWATGVITKQTLAHVHGLPTVATTVAARHIAPTPLDGDGRSSVWSHSLGSYESVRVAIVADRPEEFAGAVLHIHGNRSAWEELSVNSARFSRSGGGGKGVCPHGVREDWHTFWRKMESSACSSIFS